MWYPPNWPLIYDIFTLKSMILWKHVIMGNFPAPQSYPPIALHFPSTSKTNFSLQIVCPFFLRVQILLLWLNIACLFSFLYFFSLLLLSLPSLNIKMVPEIFKDMNVFPKSKWVKSDFKSLFCTPLVGGLFFCADEGKRPCSNKKGKPEIFGYLSFSFKTT